MTNYVRTKSADWRADAVSDGNRWAHRVHQATPHDRQLAALFDDASKSLAAVRDYLDARLEAQREAPVEAPIEKPKALPFPLTNEEVAGPSREADDAATMHPDGWVAIRFGNPAHHGSEYRRVADGYRCEWFTSPDGKKGWASRHWGRAGGYKTLYPTLASAIAAAPPLPPKIRPPCVTCAALAIVCWCAVPKCG